jgi:hypothetical protein
MSPRYWGIFWIDASTIDSIQHGLIQTATVLRVDPDIDSVKRVLANTSQSWLLVFDNADDPNLSLAPYFPAGNRGDIIITSRIPECRLYNTVGCTEIGRMSPDDSVALLAKTVFGNATLDDKLKETALTIVETLGCLALAVVHAGEYICETSCSLEAFLQHYQERRLEFLRYPPLHNGTDYHYTEQHIRSLNPTDERLTFVDSAYGTASHGQVGQIKFTASTEMDTTAQEDDDSRTEYSDISTAESNIYTYMECLVDDLVSAAYQLQPVWQRIRDLCKVLPDLLQHFALRIGQEAPYQEGREVMFYVHRHRR